MPRFSPLFSPLPPLRFSLFSPFSRRHFRFGFFRCCFHADAAISPLLFRLPMPCHFRQIFAFFAIYAACASPPRRQAAPFRHVDAPALPRQLSRSYCAPRRYARAAAAAYG
jgi:hypothetical protein